MKQLRIVSQFLFFGVFIFIFIRSLDPFNTVENPFLKFDFLILLTHLKTGLKYALPVAALLIATVVFGRFFCGWVCPLGSVIDALDFILTPVRRINPLGRHMGSFKKRLAEIPPAWFLLGAVAVTAFFAPPVLQFFHPHIWIIRIFSLYTIGLIFLGFLLLLSLHSRRFWCTAVCPLGALYGLLASVPLFRLHITGCSSCGRCDSCPMRASDYRKRKMLDHQCILCFDYEARCPVKGFQYGFMDVNPDVDLSRRRFLRQGAVTAGGLAFGALLTAVDKNISVFRNEIGDGRDIVHTDLIRPPGVTAVSNETDFVQRCLRCLQCVRSCPNQIIKATGPGKGFDSLLTPHIQFEQYGCDYYCQMCQLVCPNYAIPLQTLQEKQTTKMGLAHIHRRLCVVYANDTNCLVCEEVCPVPEKAIKIREGTKIVNGEEITLRYPYMDLDLCIGCGICQVLCPASPKAIVVYR
jgi:polyferredoxin